MPGDRAAGLAPCRQRRPALRWAATANNSSGMHKGTLEAIQCRRRNVPGLRPEAQLQPATGQGIQSRRQARQHLRPEKWRQHSLHARCRRYPSIAASRSFTSTESEQHKCCSRGFTLLEVMIACAIVAILAAIAYPSYINSVQKSRRSEATAALLGIASQMERFSTEKGTYATATLGTGAAAVFPNHTENSYYNLSLANLSATTYTITRLRRDTGDRPVRHVHLHRARCQGRQRRNLDQGAVLVAIAAVTCTKAITAAPRRHLAPGNSAQRSCDLPCSARSVARLENDRRSNQMRPNATGGGGAWFCVRGERRRRRRVSSTSFAACSCRGARRSSTNSRKTPGSRSE